jgi:hypothetical protein
MSFLLDTFYVARSQADPFASVQIKNEIDHHKTKQVDSTVSAGQASLQRG